MSKRFDHWWEDVWVRAFVWCVQMLIKIDQRLSAPMEDAE